MQNLPRMDTRVRCLAMAAAIAAVLVPTAGLSVDYKAIADQNLFDPQRKPWAEPGQQAPAAPTIGPEDVQVQGVIIVGDVRRAIIRLGGRLRQLVSGAGAARGIVVVREGQSLGGYTLQSVEPRQVVIVSGDSRFAIPVTRSLQRDTSPPPPLASVIQAPTAPVVEAPPQPAPAPPPSPPPSGGMFPAPGQFPSPPPTAAPSGAVAGTQAPVPQPVQNPFLQAPAQQSAPAPTPQAPPSTGMTLLEAIQAAEAARRSGQVQAPPVNPFLPRP
jgi:hypothetical protein